MHAYLSLCYCLSSVCVRVSCPWRSEHVHYAALVRNQEARGAPCCYAVLDSWGLCVRGKFSFFSRNACTVHADAYTVVMLRRGAAGIVVSIDARTVRLTCSARHPAAPTVYPLLLSNLVQHITAQYTRLVLRFAVQQAVTVRVRYLQRQWQVCVTEHCDQLKCSSTVWTGRTVQQRDVQ